VSVVGKDMAATDVIIEIETERDAVQNGHITALVGKMPLDKLVRAASLSKSCNAAALFDQPPCDARCRSRA
jgi:hypothetical protein